MRIDFENLQLQNPVRTRKGAVNKAGNCVVDTFKFSTNTGTNWKRCVAQRRIILNIF